MFEQLLTEPALQLQRDTASGSFALAAEVRYLVLKNYAAALAREDDTCHRSLLMYVEASAMDSTDTVLWHSMGTLVRSHALCSVLGFSLAPAGCAYYRVSMTILADYAGK